MKELPLRYLSVALFFSYAVLTGCASIVTGQDQQVSVATPNCPNAECTLTNPEGTYYLTTPGTVTVDKEYDDLVVSCKKEGVDPFIMQVSSSTKGMAFGNILLGGVIGAGVDMATGAAYDYPDHIINPLDCRSSGDKSVARKSGLYDEQAAELVDLEKCDEPGFVLIDGKDDIYRTRCIDGTVGVIACNMSDGCRPVNMAMKAAETGSSDDLMPQYVDEVQNIAREYKCTDSFHNTDVSSEGESWMAKCPNGDFLVISCSRGICAVTE
jgi:hypothetical protein